MAKSRKSKAPAATTATAVATAPEPRPVLAVFRACEAIYRFLASLKLAVISLSLLAFTLGYATFFESSYGTAAVQEWIYQSLWFSILLALLAANILCAALIRYPWKRRQTGFVITHASLLVLLGGSFWAVKSSDEGQVAALEGEVKEELVRNDYPVLRVRQVDPRNPEEIQREWELPFRPGAFGWGPGQPRMTGPLGALTALFQGKDTAKPDERLTDPSLPFQLVVKSHIPASIPAVKHEADPHGAPMARIRPKFKAPNMPQPRDVFADERDQWFVSDRRLHKIVKSEGPAQFAFYHVDTPELVEEFLNPPEDAGSDGVARFRYTDKAGQQRRFDWKLDGQNGKSSTLPDSDLSIKFLDVVGFPAGEAGLGEMLGEATVPIAEFEVNRAGQPPVKHFALANLPMFPNVIPSARAEGAPPPKPLVAVTYFLPPALDAKAGRFGLVEILAGPDEKLVYRVFGRPDAGKTGGKIRAKGAIKLGAELVAFGNNPNMPMTLLFEVADYLPSGVEKPICEPVVLPPGQMGNGIPASLVELSIPDPEEPSNRVKKEFYLRRSASLDPVWKTVAFGGDDGHDHGPTAVYQLAYDVDRKPLGFELKLVDFQRGFDPGTEKASRFSSDVLLTDKSAGIREKPIHIAMNEPLTHKGYTFYQSSFIREEDPRTGRETGRVQSVFQVHKSPAWGVMYLGCLGIVLGALTQFVMRAGVFTDHGRSERLREARKAIREAERNGLPITPEMRAAANLREPDAPPYESL